MKKLSLIIGGVALGAVGYGLKKWYDQTKEENAYWTDNPLDIAGKMVQEAADKLYDGAEWLENKVLGEESPNLATLQAFKDSAENSEALKEQAGEILQEAKAQTEEIRENLSNESLANKE